MRLDLAEMQQLLESDVTWHNTRSFPGPSVVEGPRAIREFYEGLSQEFEVGEYEFERVVETDGGVVIGLHSRSRGRSSHVPLDVRWATLVQVSGGRVTRIDIYGSVERALEAAG